MREIYEKRYCEECGKETLHKTTEYALEIEHQCEKCNHQEEIIKTFF